MTMDKELEQWGNAIEEYFKRYGGERC